MVEEGTLRMCKILHHRDGEKIALTVHTCLYCQGNLQVLTTKRQPHQKYKGILYSKLHQGMILKSGERVELKGSFGPIKQEPLILLFSLTKCMPIPLQV